MSTYHYVPRETCVQWHETRNSRSPCYRIPVSRGDFVGLMNKGTCVPPDPFVIGYDIQIIGVLTILRRQLFRDPNAENFRSPSHRTQVSLSGLRVSEHTFPGPRETSIRGHGPRELPESVSGDIRFSVLERHLFGGTPRNFVLWP